MEPLVNYLANVLLNSLETSTMFTVLCWVVGFSYFVNKLLSLSWLVTLHTPITRINTIRYKTVIYALAAGYIKNYVYRRANGHSLSIWFLLIGGIISAKQLYKPCYLVLVELAETTPTGVWVNVGDGEIRDGEIRGGYYPACRRFKHVGVDPKTPKDKIVL